MKSPSRLGVLLAGGVILIAVTLQALYIDVAGLVGRALSASDWRHVALLLAGFLAGRCLELAVRRRDIHRSGPRS